MSLCQSSRDSGQGYQFAFLGKETIVRVRVIHTAQKSGVVKTVVSGPPPRVQVAVSDVVVVAIRDCCGYGEPESRGV